MLADIVGFEIKRDEVTSLRRLLDHDVAQGLAKITEVCGRGRSLVHCFPLSHGLPCLLSLPPPTAILLGALDPALS